MLKAVLMDIDDTLLDFGKCAEQAMRIERGEGYFSAADKQRAAADYAAARKAHQ